MTESFIRSTRSVAESVEEIRVEVVLLLKHSLYVLALDILAYVLTNDRYDS